MNRRRAAAAIALPAVLAALLAGAAPLQEPARAPRFPNVLIVTVDALRADRLSAYGYRRPTTPNLDRLLAAGVRFREARTVEPLTNPAICSMLTSLYPHEHGATRNGLRLRPGLPSLATVLGRRGYKTAAFIGNWTLKNALSGLGEHFETYGEVLGRKRWLGLFKGEATAEDLTAEALAWLAAGRGRAPFLLWVHYVEPHAPYRLQTSVAGRLGVATGGEVSRSDRYDTEVAFADHHIGRLLAAIEGDPALRAETLVVFAADHGESLGEHGYWGHGRNLYEPTLLIPMGLAWPGRIHPGTIDAPALNIDLAPTVLGLAGLPVPDGFRGFDWTPVLRGEQTPPRGRVAWFEAHKGAVLSTQEAASARRAGLLEVALLAGGRKEVFHVGDRRRWLFDLASDPREERSATGSAPSEPLRGFLATVERGLAASDRQPVPGLDPESARALRALGYAQ
jgi:arylsulfatase A-like enzyme